MKRLLSICLLVLLLPMQAAEQERVVDPPAGDRVAQRAGDVLLAHDLVERGRAVLAGDGEVGHPGSPKGPP